MTRKCALCKGTNYKNNYSFFSAPKDAETRKKWQVALALENYTVTDDTYVCSKHFNKNDIITHWISGVPPQVVKVKYKKCRLRPGAVPGRNSYSVSNSRSTDQHEININDFSIFKKEQTLEKNKTLLIKRSKRKTLNDDKYVVNRNTNTYYQTYSKLQSYAYNGEGEESCDFNNVELTNTKGTNKRDADATCNLKFEDSESEKKKLDKILECDNSPNFDVLMTESVDSVDTDKEKKENVQISNESCSNVPRYASYASSENNETLVKTCKHDVSNMQDTSVYDKGCETNMLFEDFLEVCTELSIPHGWSCLITSKGHDTTVVYLYMNITKNGLPFVEKQIFIRSDMVLHYSVANTEIDPLVHNLIKERKHNKIRSLLDVEILIAEFDQRAVCQGICDSRDYKSVDAIKVLYMDGVKWRHISCPLILNNDNSRCTRCATLSRFLLLTKF
ncbi:uncharacterized protein LOC105284593 isoform X1 [Ooceraea biroi]|nr:uncharacterized protein LOC105284593 isoform X1 [Ooceraea biroi]XP_026826595.1 uncharacterized protein LOC105284593 isoform X1 [Ooceraea biroi]